MNLNNINNNTLFEELKTRLEARFGQLPDFGIIAGQAVASACYDYAGTGFGPMKDLDVFVHEDEAPFCPHLDVKESIVYDEDGNIERPSYNPMRLSKSGVEKAPSLHAATCSMGQIMFMGIHDNISAGDYKITYSHVDAINPDINYVRVTLTTEEGNLTYPRMSGQAGIILNGFDINACEIAMDMHTKTVVWTEDFQNFLYHKRLSVNFFGTPMHTAVRLIEKSKKLTFATLDKEYEMARLQAARYCIMAIEHEKISDERQSKGFRGYTPGNLFSPMYKKRFEAVAGELSDYFILCENNYLFENVYLCEGIDENGRKVSNSRTKVVKRTMYTLDPHTHNEDVLNFLLTMFGGTRGGIDMSVEFFTSIFNRLYLRMTSPKQAKILKAFTEKLICSDEFEYMEIAMRRFWALHIVFDTPFARQMNIKTHHNIFKYLNKHAFLLVALSSQNQKITSLMWHTIVKQLKWMEKNHMRYYTGILEQQYNKEKPWEIREESLKNGTAPFALDLLSDNLRVDAKVKHEEYMSSLSEKVAESHLDKILSAPDMAQEKDCFTELHTAYSLFWEGEDLGHCVGGYYDLVDDGTFIIVGINTSKERYNLDARSTLRMHVLYKNDALHADFSLSASEIEHRGKGNCKPCDENIEVAGKLMMKINEALGEIHERVIRGENYDDLPLASKAKSLLMKHRKPF